MAHNKCRCGAPHDDWPGKDGDLICQMCWESDCSESMSAENEPMTTEQMEAYVRAQSKYIGIWVRDLDSYGTNQFNVAIFLSEEDANYKRNYIRRFQEDNNKTGIAAVWAAVWSFTQQREQEIAELEREIRLMAKVWNTLGNERHSDPMELADAKRTLAHLNAILEDKKKGMGITYLTPLERND